jgi:hypothetical protein
VRYLAALTVVVLGALTFNPWLWVLSLAVATYCVLRGRKEFA